MTGWKPIPNSFTPVGAVQMDERAGCRAQISFGDSRSLRVLPVGKSVSAWYFKIRRRSVAKEFGDFRSGDAAAAGHRDAHNRILHQPATDRRCRGGPPSRRKDPSGSRAAGSGQDGRGCGTGPADRRAGAGRERTDPGPDGDGIKAGSPRYRAPAAGNAEPGLAGCALRLGARKTRRRGFPRRTDPRRGAAVCRSRCEGPGNDGHRRLRGHAAAVVERHGHRHSPDRPGGAQGRLAGNAGRGGIRVRDGRGPWK